MPGQDVFQWSFDCLADRDLVVQSDSASLASDAGLRVVRQFDQRIGVTRRLAGCLRDDRDRLRDDAVFERLVRDRYFDDARAAARRAINTARAGSRHRHQPTGTPSRLEVMSNPG